MFRRLDSGRLAWVSVGVIGCRNPLQLELSRLSEGVGWSQCTMRICFEIPLGIQKATSAGKFGVLA